MSAESDDPITAEDLGSGPQRVTILLRFERLHADGGDTYWESRSDGFPDTEKGRRMVANMKRYLLARAVADLAKQSERGVESEIEELSRIALMYAATKNTRERRDPDHPEKPL